MESIFRTDTGKIRTLNEDSGGLFYNNDNLLAIVADGMGGHQAGEIASSMAVSYLKEQWKKVEIELNPAKTEEWLVENVQNANKKLLEFAKTNPDCHGMGTTVVSVICTPNYVTLAHIGDSRIYLLNEDGFSLLTEDHSLVNELVKNGQISKEEAEHHPRKHVLLRALGTEEQVEIDIRSISWEPNDVVLLCSDGLTNKVDEKVIQKTISSDSPIHSKAEELISLANQAGGDDNITLILIKHGFSNEKKVNEYD